MRTLKTFKEVYTPKSPDENNFVKKHIVQKTEDKNGNKDDVFNATNIKAVDREKTHHGYNANSDEKVYEAKEDKCSECGKVHEGTCTNESVEVDEESMTGAQMKKREEIVKGMKKGVSEFKKKYGPDWKKVMYAKAMKEGAEIAEAERRGATGAQQQYDTYHKHARELLGKIGKALDDHQKAAKNYKSTSLMYVGEPGAHWGHVNDVKDIKRQLEDMHDRLTQSGEYAKNPY